MKLFLLLSLILAAFINKIVSQGAKFTTQTAIALAPGEVAKLTQLTVKNAFENPDLAIKLLQPVSKGFTRAILDGNKMVAVKVIAKSIAGGIEVFFKSLRKSLGRSLSKIKALFITPKEIPPIPPTYYSRFTDGLQTVGTSLTSLQTTIYSLNTRIALQSATYIHTDAIEEGARGAAYQFFQRAKYNTGGGTNPLAAAFGKTFVEQFKLHPSTGLKISMSVLKTAVPIIFKHFIESINGFFKALFKLFKDFMTKTFLAVKKIAMILHGDVTRSGPLLDPLPAVSGVIFPDTVATRQFSNKLIATLTDFRVIAGSVAVIAVGGGIAIGVAKNSD